MGKKGECGSSKWREGRGGKGGGGEDEGSNWCPSDEEHASVKLKGREG